MSLACMLMIINVLLRLHGYAFMCVHVCVHAVRRGVIGVCAERDRWASIETTHIKPAAIQSDVDRG